MSMHMTGAGVCTFPQPLPEPTAEAHGSARRTRELQGGLLAGGGRAGGTVEGAQGAVAAQQQRLRARHQFAVYTSVCMLACVCVHSNLTHTCVHVWCEHPCYCELASEAWVCLGTQQAGKSRRGGMHPPPAYCTPHVLSTPCMPHTLHAHAPHPACPTPCMPHTLHAPHPACSAHPACPSTPCMPQHTLHAPHSSRPMSTSGSRKK